jgi:hypothetical protein
MLVALVPPNLHNLAARPLAPLLAKQHAPANAPRPINREIIKRVVMRYDRVPPHKHKPVEREPADLGPFGAGRVQHFADRVGAGYSDALCVVGAVPVCAGEGYGQGFEVGLLRGPER